MDIKVKVFDSETAFGYTQISTFYQDFGIAEIFGINAVRDTYKQAFASWKYDYKYLTELVMVLNWKIWEHFKTNTALAEVYNDLYEKAKKYATTHLKGVELEYYYKTTN